MSEESHRVVHRRTGDRGTVLAVDRSRNAAQVRWDTEREANWEAEHDLEGLSLEERLLEERRG